MSVDVIMWLVIAAIVVPLAYVRHRARVALWDSFLRRTETTHARLIEQLRRERAKAKE